MTEKEREQQVREAYRATIADKSARLTVSACTGKMAGQASISTTLYLCKGCMARRLVKGSVCEYCYAARMPYLSALKAYARNTAILDRAELSQDVISDAVKGIRRKAKAGMCRYLTHGDLSSYNCLINLAAIAAAAPDIRFSLMTKERAYLVRYAQECAAGLRKKPANLKLVYSSLFVNNCQTEPLERGLVDEVFTVYESAVDIPAGADHCHCGPGSCAHCGQCYAGNSARLVGEILRK